MVNVVVCFKCRILLGSFVIISFVKPLIGKIIAIMHSGNNTVKLEFIFHKDVVLAFSIIITSINKRERLQGVLDDWINVWLEVLYKIVILLVGESF